MNSQITFIKNILKKNGYKFTYKKELILKTILNSKDHLNALDVYEKLKSYEIGIATIYRGLKVFGDLGIFKETNINGTNYYEMKIFSKKPIHIHFKCNKCNNIKDIKNEELTSQYLKLMRNIEKENNIEIYDSDVMFVGLCKNYKED